MSLPGIFINIGGAKEVNIVNTESAGGATRDIKNSLPLSNGEDRNLLPAIERRKNIMDKRIFRMAKFKNRSPK